MPQPSPFCASFWRVVLLALGVRELDETLDLCDGKRGKPFAKLLDCFPEIVAANNGFRHDSRSAHDRPA